MVNKSGSSPIEPTGPQPTTPKAEAPQLNRVEESTKEVAAKKMAKPAPTPSNIRQIKNPKTGQPIKVKPSPVKGSSSQQIQKTYQSRILSQTTASITQAAQQTGKQAVLPGLSASQNPVTHIESEFFVPRAAAENVQTTPQEVGNSLVGSAKELAGRINGAYNGKKNGARDDIQKAYEKQKPAAGELDKQKGAIEAKRADGKKAAEEKRKEQFEGIEQEIDERVSEGVQATEKQIEKLEKQRQSSGDTGKLQAKIEKLKKSISAEALDEMREEMREEIAGEYEGEYQEELKEVNAACDRDLQALMDPAAKDVEQATKQIEAERVAIQQFLSAQFGTHIGRPLQGSSNLREVIDQAKQDLQAEKAKQQPGSIQERICTRLIESLDAVEVTIDLNSVSSVYDQGVIETNLLQLLGKIPEDDVEARGAILEEIGAIRREMKGFVAQKQVDAMIERLSQNPSLKDVSVGQILKKNLEPFVSSTEVMAVNGGKELVLKKLKELSGPPRSDRPGFAFKLGAENRREILAGQLNERIGFNRYLVPKHEVSIAGAKLGQTSSPEGIASEWLASGKSLPRESLSHYHQLRKEVAAKRARGEDPSEEMVKLTALRQQLVAAEGGKRDEGIMHQALMNITLQSFDSHIGQFLQVDGQTYGFDEARLLAPSLAYQEESGTYVTFRSALVGHPACQETMPQEMVEHLRSMPIDEIQSGIVRDGLVFTPEEFAQAHTEWQALVADEALWVGGGRVGRLELCNRYGVEATEEELASGKGAVTLNKIAARKEEMKNAAFKKIHPEAFKQMIGRLQAQQEYVRETENPTIEGMFHHVYPQLTPFLRVLERLDVNPSDSIGLGMIGGMFQPRSLERLIADAKSEGLATAEELATMEAALKEIRQSACPTSAVQLTMEA